MKDSQAEKWANLPLCCFFFFFLNNIILWTMLHSECERWKIGRCQFVKEHMFVINSDAWDVHELYHKWVFFHKHKCNCITKMKANKKLISISLRSQNRQKVHLIVMSRRYGLFTPKKLKSKTLFSLPYRNDLYAIKSSFSFHFTDWHQS